MTREEAKEALSVLKIYDNQWLREAIDMAIEALQTEVVMCKNCKNRARYAVYNFFAEDGFCPHGERSNHEQQKERE